MRSTTPLRSWLLLVILFISGVGSIGAVPAPADAQRIEDKPRFISEKFDLSIVWGSPWFVVDHGLTDDFEYLRLRDEFSSVIFFVGPAISNDALTELQYYQQQSGADATDFRVLQTDGDDSSAFGYHSFSTPTVDGGSYQSVEYVRFEIRSDGAEIIIVALANAVDLSRYESLWPTLTDWVETKPTGISEALSSSWSEHNWFYFDPGVSQKTREVIAEGIRFAEDYFRKEFHVVLPHTTYVTAVSTSRTFGGDSAALAVGNGIVIFAGNEFWQTDFTAIERLGAVVHEYTHLYQFWAVEDTLAPDIAWLEEGFAEYIALEAISTIGVTKKSEIHSLYQQIVRAATNLPTLESLESRELWISSGADVYSLGYLAVDFLFTQTGTGPSAFADYYSNLTMGESFSIAFERAFGISVSDFYREFESQMVFLPQVFELPPDLIPLPDDPPPSWASFTLVPTLMVSDIQAVFHANSEPGANCRLRIILDGDEHALVDRSTQSNGSGELFWLVTLPDDVRPSTAETTVSCGGLRDRATVIVAR